MNKEFRCLYCLKVILLFCFSFSFISCSIFYKRIPQVAWENEMEGYASWYGKEYHGRKTSSGEIYDMYALTAAHRTIPLGSEIRVSNLENGKTVDVRINDRGPFVDGRIIDLSYNSAKEIGMLTQGSAMVRLTLLKKTSSAKSAGYIVQAGSFLMLENALQLRGALVYLDVPVFIETIETNAGKFHRVRAGPIKDKDAALEIISQLREKNIHPYLIGAD